MNAVLMNLLLTGAAKGNHGYRSAAFGYSKATISTKDVGGYTTFAASKPGQLKRLPLSASPKQRPEDPTDDLPSNRAAQRTGRALGHGLYQAVPTPAAGGT